MSIITSLLDTDYYKITMGNLAYCQFPDMHVKYRFKLRGPYGIEWTLREKMDIINELEMWCDLKFTQNEIYYLEQRNLFDKSYIEFLSTYSPNMAHFDLGWDGDLHITVEGPWCQTIFWEIAVLAIVSEVYSRRFSSDGMPSDMKYATKKLIDNMEVASGSGMKWADFGTRRRFSRAWQEKCVEKAASEKRFGFVGTSNVYLAMKYDVKPIGTMAHEYLSVGQAIAHPLDAQKEMLQRWCDQYRGNLGIALTDIVGIDSFIRDFDHYFAKLYDGVRHDSGDPYWWADKVIRHYKDLSIDPMTKTAVFSEGLDFPKAAALDGHYRDIINVSSGIGTKFTNDVGITPLQIVMKIVEVNGRPVAKISDSHGKGMCEDADYVSYIKKVHGIGETQ